MSIKSSSILQALTTTKIGMAKAFKITFFIRTNIKYIYNFKLNAKI